MAKISIVIPVYNVEEYLALSLASAMTQTYEDIEIVCVNDGSTDKSLEILEAAQAKDNRIQIITKRNGGLSSARNVGIDAAKGEYICFLDSDDLFEPEACETIIEVFDDTNADIVTYGATAYPEFRGYTWLNEVLSPRDIIYDGFHPDLLFEESSCPFVWRTACKTSFLRKYNIRFDESLAFGEDQVFHFAVYPRSSKTALISNKLLKYRVSREGSLMFLRKGSVSDKISDHIQIVSEIYKDWNSIDMLNKYPNEILLWSADFILPELCHQSKSDKKKLYPQLKKIWLTYFSENFLKEAQTTNLIGPLLKLVLEDNYSSIGYFARLKYYVAKDGAAKVIKHKLYTSFFGFLHPFRKIGRNLLPKSSSKRQRAIEEKEWDKREELERKKATDNLLSKRY